jgi:hypothetical protein
LNIDDRIFLISRWSSSPYPFLSDIRWNYDANGYLIDHGSAAGSYDDSVGYEYSNDGSLTRVAYPASYTQGDEGFGIVKKYRYEYNEAGNLTLLEAELYGKFVIEKNIFEITSKSTETREYDASGAVKQIVRKVNDEDGDGAPDHIEKWEFNANGDLTRYDEGEYDLGALLPVTIQENRYDDEGRMAEVKYDASSNSKPNSQPGCLGDLGDIIVGDGIAVWTAAYQYDVQGRQIRVELNGECLVAAATALNLSTITYLSLGETYVVTYQYGTDGNLTQEILDGFSSIYGHEIVTRTYDVRGNVTREEDQIMLLPSAPPYPGELYSLTEYGYEYNEFGDLIRRTTDEGGDGSLERTESWEYEFDANGNLTQYGSDLTENTFQYEPTGWGHIFASPPPPDNSGVDSYPLLFFGIFPNAWPEVSSPLEWLVYLR